MKTFLVITILFFLNATVGAFTVLLDPGHGGRNTGAQAVLTVRRPDGMLRRVKVYEKDIVLRLSKRIYRKLKKKGYRTFLSRRGDRTVSLQERAALLKKVNPDVYLSVHVNSSKKGSPKGFETYYLDNHNDVAVKKLEQVENRNLMGKERVVNRILSDLVIERTVHSSRRLARAVHFQVKRLVGRRFQMVDRGVRPGFFYVLTLAKRPSILLEIGFLSNPRELRKILNPRFQERYAEAVVRGLEHYLKRNPRP